MWYLFLLETVVTVLCFAKNALFEVYFLFFLTVLLLEHAV